MDLPQGWIISTLNHVTENSQYGYTTKASEEGSLKFLRTTDITQGIINWETVPFCLENPDKIEKFLLKSGDIVISRSGSIGFNYVIKDLPEPTVYASYLIRFRPVSLICNDFLGLFLKSNYYWEQIYANASGNAMQNINAQKLSLLNVILPPLAEQQEIVRVVESHLKLVDQIKSRLDALPKILEQFRQSVLASAVSGKLTEDWRASKQLNLTDWDNGLLGNKAQVKGGKRLPKGEQLLQEKTNYPYIRAGQLKKGTVSDEGLLYLSEYVHNQISQYTVKEGDVYITIVGACIGDVGVIPMKYDGANLTENAAKITNFGDELNNYFLNIILRSSYFQQVISDEKKSAAQGKLALKRIRDFVIPLPSPEEQYEIVKRVENLFALADQIEAKIKNAQERVNLLTQSILAKAFRGELTAKWREDNPDLISGENSAEALLKRIEAEKKNSKKK